MRERDQFEVKGWTFAQGPVWLLCDQRLTHSAKVVALYLVYRQRNEGSCFPSLPRMAADLHMHENTVRRLYRELEDAGYLTVTHRPGRSNVYRFSALPDKKMLLNEKLIQELENGGTNIRQYATPTTDGTPTTDCTPTVVDTPPLPQAVPTPTTDGTRNKKHLKEKPPNKNRESPDQKTWQRVLALLEPGLTRATFDTWLKPTQAYRRDGAWVIVAPSAYSKDWLENRMQGVIRRAFDMAEIPVEKLEFEAIKED